LKLSLPAGEVGVPQLVELIPKGARKAIGRGFVIRRGDVEIEFGPDFDEEALGRVLRVAGTC